VLQRQFIGHFCCLTLQTTCCTTVATACTSVLILEQNETTEFGVLSLIDDTHAAADVLDNAVVRNSLVDHVIDVLIAAAPSGAAGRRSGDRSEFRPASVPP
jgi:hypothetical protein